MPTSTNVTNLKINELKEAQYDTAVSGGVIGANELSILTDVDAGQVIQVATLPTAGADELDNIYQFIGTTDANYTNGYFYKCTGAGEPVVYSWSRVDVQPSSSLPTQTGNAGKFLTTDGTGASWASTNVSVGGTLDRSLVVGGGTASGLNNTSVGCLTTNQGTGTVCVGFGATATVNNAIALGSDSHATAAYARQIGSGTNSTENTVSFGNANGNFEMMSADGTIPAARHASLPASDGTYVLKLVISSGVPTLSWVAE